MPTTTVPNKSQTELQKLRQELLRQILKNEAQRRSNKAK
jgi:hypothetical protein